MMKSLREIMQEMTEDQKANAYHAHRAICEGVPALLTYDEAKELEALGMLEDVSEPQTGKKNRGHFTFTFSDRLEDFVRIRVLENQIAQLQSELASSYGQEKDLRTRLSTAERERDEAREQADFWKHNFNAILLQAKQVGCSEIDVGLEDGSTNRVLKNDLADTLKARVEELEECLRGPARPYVAPSVESAHNPNKEKTE